MRTFTVLAVVTAGMFAACAASVPADKQLITDAATALGGVERLVSLKSLTFEATGTAPNAGQNRMPDDELPVWRVTEFTRTTDLARGRTQVKQVREAQFLFAGELVQRQTQGLDDAIAYNVTSDGTVARASDAAAHDRHVEMLHHPLTIIRAALEPSSLLANPRAEGGERLVDIAVAGGDTLTLAIDAQTHLPTRVTSMADNANMGDVAIVTTFADYQDVNGIKLPRRLTTKMDKYLQLDLTVTRNQLDADVKDLAAPDAVKSAQTPDPPPVVVTAEPVANGIWWLAGSGNHRSVVFEFADHLVLYEVPLNEARTKAVIDKARTLSPKPLTTAIVTHHHFDHSGGLRTAVAEGLIIITHRANETFFKELLSRPHTLVPDALQKNPRDARFVFVDDQLTLKDAALEVQLYHLLDNPREGTNLFAYVPAQKILVQADLYDSTWLRHSWGDNVIANIERRKLAIARDVPVHGAIEPYSQMVATIRARPGATPSRN